MLSKDTVNRYLTKTLGCKSFKRYNIILSDDSPFPLFCIPNEQVDRIWEKISGKSYANETIKKSQEIQVCGAISASGLSDLHIMPQSFPPTAHSYVSDILVGHPEII
ncbi:unnamed protein product [Lepeophtheirus salmonis]|uniref:(salmon louse) hypothetical protein n=1 Tax=Lepeophtheirus salmonis TaxID=72036 RepID=A0A7R8CQH2_LEPSM|nr:unnamed protein product [Lepeophtheirus salmonis]CAF2895309.1 unnamed protein product [Lepeophtheirus salmonis]